MDELDNPGRIALLEASIACRNNELLALRKQLEEAWEARDQYLHSNVQLKDEILALRKRVAELERLADAGAGSKGGD